MMSRRMFADVHVEKHVPVYVQEYVIGIGAGACIWTSMFPGGKVDLS